MLNDLDSYFAQQEEPTKGCLLFLREYILKSNKDITETWKYRMPFYCYNGKRFCYLWVEKKSNKPYLGIVDGKKVNHPKLIMEKRARMKIMLFDPEKDLPLKDIDLILKTALKIYL